MMNQQQKAALKQIARWKYISSPNGSAFQKEYLPEGSHKNVGGFAAINIQAEYNYGYIVRFFDGVLPSEKIIVRFGWVSVGPGTDFGMYYNTRDQALVALQ